MLTAEKFCLITWGGVTLLDNTGDNISADNPYWGELTGLYWIWKNIKFNDDDIVGFCHYNKMIDISERGIKKFFKKNPRGWLILKRDCHELTQTYPPDIAINKILSQDFPEYYAEWKKFFTYDNDTSVCLVWFSPCQMFYTDAKSFDEYCEFLFDVLFRLRSMVGDVDYPSNSKRYCAYIGESLMTIFLERNHKTYKIVERCVDSSWLYRFLSRTAHKLKLNINARYYILIRDFFRKHTHYRPATSSWAKA